MCRTCAADRQACAADPAREGRAGPAFRGSPGWRGWALCSIATAIAVVVFAAASTLASSPDPGAPFGLFQRLATVAGWGWIALVALRLLTAEPPASRWD